MPKHEFLTPKAIANRIKAKGLQKLRWYCQMCQKQCRDENGFKCHTMSESHQRQLLLFAENPDKYVDSFSKEFEDSFLELLNRRFGTKRVHANQVYQEFITDRNHLHMNATQWETLTEFVKWLGKEGKCVVDQTEKGWFITYVDRDPETIHRQEQLAKKEKLEMDDEEKMAQFIQKQIELAKATVKEPPDPVFTELKRENEEEKFTINMTLIPKKESVQPSSSKLLAIKNPLTALKKKDTFRDDVSIINSASSQTGNKRKCALKEIIEEEEKKREKLSRKDYWLTKGIVVKVITQKIGEKYYRKKALVKDVQDLYTGIIKMLDSGDVLKVDQTHVETVIPAQSKLIKVVNGAYRGSEAVLMSLQESQFCVTIKINSGPLKGRIIDGVKYEDICKIHIPSL